MGFLRPRGVGGEHKEAEWLHRIETGATLNCPPLSSFDSACFSLWFSTGLDQTSHLAPLICNFSPCPEFYDCHCSSLSRQ